MRNGVFYNRTIAKDPIVYVILFVHGATTPPQAGLDLKLDGLSWMEWMARQGNDVYFVSVRG